MVRVRGAAVAVVKLELGAARGPVVHVADANGGAGSQIAVLAEGVIAERGTHDNLMAARGGYATWFALQASAYQDARVGVAACDLGLAARAALVVVFPVAPTASSSTAERSRA